MKRRNLQILMVLPFLFSCALLPKKSIQKDSLYKKEGYITEGYSQVGIASWYGIEEHNRQAASGERFSMHAYTAAHKTLPLGTMVRVTNLENGKDVIVKINDRGPFVEGRIIDLSYAAAKAIDMIRDGTVKVKIEVISSPQREGNYFEPLYTVQAGSFVHRQNAINLRERLANRWNDVRVEPIEIGGDIHYRVRIGRFKKREDAEKVSSKLKEEIGYRGKVILE
ncbi:Endolytic peptidoglycan transglycosylase RlpA [bacterium HR37]|nr:Endolytic peptidoglycan transglycosylase RlpA [bacterium HR37]